MNARALAAGSENPAKFRPPFPFPPSFSLCVHSIKNQNYLPSSPSPVRCGPRQLSDCLLPAAKRGNAGAFFPSSHPPPLDPHRPPPPKAPHDASRVRRPVLVLHPPGRPSPTGLSHLYSSSVKVLLALLSPLHRTHQSPRSLSPPRSLALTASLTEGSGPRRAWC